MVFVAAHSTVLAGTSLAGEAAAPSLQALNDPAASARPSNTIETFRDCPDLCPEMVVVQAGSFVMGSSELKRIPLTGKLDDFFASEGPPQEVSISKPFAVGIYEVTWAEWEACVEAGACDGASPEATGGDNGWGKGRHPVIEVSWQHAQEYLRWLSKKTGYEYRLLTEAEWEYAARAKTQTHFAWGNDVGTEKANCNGCGSFWDNRMTAPVGSFEPNSFGIYDMHGNVREWVEDCWTDSHEGLPPDGSARTRPDCMLHVVRGGAWNLQPMYVRSSARDCYHPKDQLNTVGFRVARSVKGSKN